MAEARPPTRIEAKDDLAMAVAEGRSAILRLDAFDKSKGGAIQYLSYPST